MDIFKLNRKFWDFAFENPERIKLTHIGIYYFAVEHCNRLGWKKKFGLPTSMVMEATSIKSYNTYIKAFNDLVEFGFFELHQKSKNQYSSNVIALSNFDKALDKALDKAIIKHTTKQPQKQLNGSSSIIIQETRNKKQETNIQVIPTFKDFLIYAVEHKPNVCETDLNLKYQSWVVNDWKDGNNVKIKNWKSKLLNTLKYIDSGKNSITVQKVALY
jgi:hypothetical protein